MLVIRKKFSEVKNIRIRLWCIQRNNQHTNWPHSLSFSLSSILFLNFFNTLPRCLFLSLSVSLYHPLYLIAPLFCLSLYQPHLSPSLFVSLPLLLFLFILLLNFHFFPSPLLFHFSPISVVVSYFRPFVFLLSIFPLYLFK